MLRQTLDASRFNPAANLPFELRLKDFELAIQDVCDFFFDVNVTLAGMRVANLERAQRHWIGTASRNCAHSGSIGLVSRRARSGMTRRARSK